MGNSLSLELREQYFTPAHYVYGWDAKLRWKKMMDYAVTYGRRASRGEINIKKGCIKRRNQTTGKKENINRYRSVGYVLNNCDLPFSRGYFYLIKYKEALQ